MRLVRSTENSCKLIKIVDSFLTADHFDLNAFNLVGAHCSHFVRISHTEKNADSECFDKYTHTHSNDILSTWALSIADSNGNGENDICGAFAAMISFGCGEFSFIRNIYLRNCWNFADEIFGASFSCWNILTWTDFTMEYSTLSTQPLTMSIVYIRMDKKVSIFLPGIKLIRALKRLKPPQIDA